MVIMNSCAPSLLLHLVPEDPEPVRDQITRQLRDRIVRGELERGESLPGHRRLARQHRIAPSTVAAAYEVLVNDGLLAGTPTAGVRVADIEPERRREMVERLQLDKLVAQELGRRELEMARDVQKRLLPPPEIEGERWKVAARCLPARIVAGDFYDVLRHPDGSVDVVVADVAGKGFAASLIMASVKAMLPFVTADGGVADALTALNRRLAIELGRGEFVALTLSRFHPDRGHIEIANAGAPDPYLIGPGCEPEPLSVPGPRLPLGIRAEVDYQSRTAELGRGAGLLMLTDGLPEAQDADGEPLGYQMFEAMLTHEPLTGEPFSWLVDLFDRIQRTTGRMPEDDWTATLLTPKPTEGGEL
jgi:serine phosphatase RsbU (regulator of sigma subunit)